MTQAQTQVVIMGAGDAGLLATVRLARKLRHEPVAITLVPMRSTTNDVLTFVNILL